MFLFEEYELVKSNTDDFIKKSKKIHGDRYDYSKVNYISSSDPVEIICPIHGPFTQIPSEHLRGSGCKKCGIERTAKSKASDKEEFIKKAKFIYGDKYDYSKVNYTTNKNEVEIICNKHNLPFTATPNQLLLKRKKCPKCSGIIRNTQDFINRAKEIYGDKYDYSRVNYINLRKKNRNYL